MRETSATGAMAVMGVERERAWGGADPLDPRVVAERALRVAERAALGVLGDREVAADVAQEVAITAVGRAHTVRDPAALDAWLYRVAVRAALTQARRDRSRREAERASAAGAERVTPAVDDGRMAEALELLEGLPPRQRAALALRYVHDLPDAAIARALRCRKATVRTLLSRGRKALRERLGTQLTEPQEEATCP